MPSLLRPARNASPNPPPKPSSVAPRPSPCARAARTSPTLPRHDDSPAPRPPAGRHALTGAARCSHRPLSTGGQVRLLLRPRQAWRAIPAFGAILHRGWIAPGSRVLDLGCGQGLLASLLLAAGSGCRVQGIELMPRDAQRATTALGDAARDRLRRHPFGGFRQARMPLSSSTCCTTSTTTSRSRCCSACALRCNPAGYCCCGWATRTPDCRSGSATGSTTSSPSCAAIVWPRLYCRPSAQWRKALEALGFQVEVVPLSHGTPFANVMLKARLRAA